MKGCVFMFFIVKLTGSKQIPSANKQIRLVKRNCFCFWQEKAPLEMRTVEECFTSWLMIYADGDFRMNFCRYSRLFVLNKFPFFCAHICMHYAINKYHSISNLHANAYSSAAAIYCLHVCLLWSHLSWASVKSINNSIESHFYLNKVLTNYFSQLFLFISDVKLCK